MAQAVPLFQWKGQTMPCRSAICTSDPSGTVPTLSTAVGTAKDPYDAGEVAAAHMICELVRDVDDECEYADGTRHSAPKPAADATVTGRRIGDGPTGSEFSRAASNVDYAALMGALDDRMPCIEAVCPKGYDAAMSQIHALR